MSGRCQRPGGRLMRRGPGCEGTAWCALWSTRGSAGAAADGWGGRSTHLAGLLHVLRRHGGLLGGSHSRHTQREGAAGLLGRTGTMHGLASARLGSKSAAGHGCTLGSSASFVLCILNNGMQVVHGRNSPLLHIPATHLAPRRRRRQGGSPLGGAREMGCPPGLSRSAVHRAGGCNTLHGCWTGG